MERAASKHTESSARFKVSATNYSTQYNHLYYHRTRDMKPALENLVKQKWGDSCKLAAKIIDTESNTGDIEDRDPAGVAIIGMVYKELKLRDSVLSTFKDGTGSTVMKMDWTKNISDPGDTVILEDPSGRAALGGPLIEKEIKRMVSGVMMAMRGNVDDAGIFHVVDMITYDECFSNMDVKKASMAGEDPKYVMIVSGLSIGASNVPENDDGNTNEFTTQLLFDFLSGRLGGDQELKKASCITRLIVAGNSVELPVADTEGAIAAGTVFGSTRTKLEKQQQEMSAETMKRFDMYLAQGLGSCDIDLMPGAEDPTTETLPQQVMHPCLFPHSSRFDSLHLVTNPYACKVDNCNIVGHSGQPLFDILRTTKWEDKDEGMPDGDAMDVATPASSGSASATTEKVSAALQALEKTLHWGHICPTAPDTLSCYPFTDTDPFVLDSANAPHILFAGNQAKFDAKLVEGTNGKYRTCVVSVPSFSKTGEAVLVDVNSLEASIISFK